MVDSDGSGVIDRKEFGILYNVIKAELKEEHEKEMALELRVLRQKRRIKVVGVFVVVLVMFLGLSVATNAIAMSYLIAASKDTSEVGGFLVAKGTNTTIAVASADLQIGSESMLMTKDGDFDLQVDQAMHSTGFQDDPTAFVDNLVRLLSESIPPSPAPPPHYLTLVAYCPSGGSPSRGRCARSASAIVSRLSTTPSMA